MSLWGNSQILNLTGAVIVQHDLSPDLKLLLKSHLANSDATLARIEAGQALLLAAFTQEKKDMSDLSNKIQVLQDAVTAETTIVGGVKVFVEGIPKLIADAVAAALAKGATPGELQSLTDLGAAIQKNSADLAAAIVAGTPVVDPPVVP